MGAEQLTRRRFVQGLAAGGAVAGLGRWEALAWAAQPGAGASCGGRAWTS